MRTRTIIRGIRDVETAIAAAEAGFDAIAFEFDQAHEAWMDPGDAFEVLSALPPLVSTVGIFRDPSVDAFSDAEETCPTSMVLLEGDESEKLVRQCGPNVIKRVDWGVATAHDDLAKWAVLDDVDAALLDVGERTDDSQWARLGDVCRTSAIPVIVAVPNPGVASRAIGALRPYALLMTLPTGGDRTWLEATCATVRLADASSR